MDTEYRQANLFIQTHKSILVEGGHTGRNPPSETRGGASKRFDPVIHLGRQPQRVTGQPVTPTLMAESSKLLVRSRGRVGVSPAGTQHPVTPRSLPPIVLPRAGLQFPKSSLLASTHQLSGLSVPRELFIYLHKSALRTLGSRSALCLPQYVSSHSSQFP